MAVVSPRMLGSSDTSGVSMTGKPSEKSMGGRGSKSRSANMSWMPSGC